jgi:hypothetical protein
MVKEKGYLLGCNGRHCCLGSKVYIEKIQTKNCIRPQRTGDKLFLRKTECMKYIK